MLENIKIVQADIGMTTGKKKPQTQNHKKPYSSWQRKGKNFITSFTLLPVRNSGS